MTYLLLYWEFFKTGLFAIGGGMATLPFLRELAEKTGWFTVEQIADMLAVSESTPGPIGVNMATYTGYTCAGVPGGIAATLGLITPPVIIILIVAKFLAAYRDNRFVQGALHGLRPASMAMIVSAGLLVLDVALLDRALFVKTGAIFDLLNWKAILLAAVLAVLMHLPKIKKLHPIVFVAIAAAAGIVFNFHP